MNNQLDFRDAQVPSWSVVSTDILRAELARRDGKSTKSPCESGIQGDYNTTAHVYALILILTLSTLACGFPLITRYTSSSSGPSKFIFISQHFGTGVLIATAFVHLLPTAFISLTDPCLPDFFSHIYNPLAGLIAMISALVVVALEMFLTARGARHSHSHVGDWDRGIEGLDDHHNSNGFSLPRKKFNERVGMLGLPARPMDLTSKDIDASQGLVAGGSPIPTSLPQYLNSTENRRSYPVVADDDSDLELDQIDPTAEAELAHGTVNNCNTLTPEERQKRQTLQCLLLEAGILFHSVFIGIAVSVATGPPFVVFLIAISFHQTFEGLALGSRIATISFPSHSPRPWLMVFAYGTTTPIGQLIGLVIHNLYNPRSTAGLLMVGIMNGISSGLLLFAGLVQLLAEDFLSDRSYGTLKGKRRVEAFSSVLAGAMLMALVGAWA